MAVPPRLLLLNLPVPVPALFDEPVPVVLPPGLLFCVPGAPWVPGVPGVKPGFFSKGIRFRLRFSSFPFLGRVSLSTGNSILPIILGPDNFLALIFSITGAVSSSFICSAGFSSTFTSTVFAVAFSSFSFAPFLAFLFSSVSSSSFAVTFCVSFFADFLGLVEESMASRSILSKTFGFSSSRALTFVKPGFSVSVISSFSAFLISVITSCFTGSAICATGSSFFTSSGFAIGAFVSFLVNDRN